MAASPIFSILAALSIAYSWWKFHQGKKELKNLRLGRDGEIAVGQFLERLREDSAHVFHDMQGEGFNVDHVVIHRSGIYAIEAKTFSKPEKGKARVLFDGERVLVNGFEPDRNPVIQARASASWIRELLLESTGKKFTVRPVVLFPGWYVENKEKGSKNQTWVLNPKACPQFIANASQLLSREDVKLASFHLGRYQRARG